MATTGTPRSPLSRTSPAVVGVGSFVSNVLKLLLWTALSLFVLSLARDEAGAQVPEAPSVERTAEVAGTEVKAGISSGGLRVEAGGSGTSAQASASPDGVQVEAGGSGTNTQVNASSGGIQASISDDTVKATASVSGAGAKVQAEPTKADLNTGPSGESARPDAPLTRASTGSIAGSQRPGEPAGATGSVGRSGQLAVAQSSGPRLAGPIPGGHGAAVTAGTGPAPGDSDSLSGDLPNRAPLLPNGSMPATAPSGGSWSPGGSPHAILTAALLLAALGLLHRMRDGWSKPPPEPVRLLASPG